MTSVAHGLAASGSRSAVARRRGRGRAARVLLGALALGYVGVILLVPLVALFREAFAEGVDAYLAALASADTWAAVRLSLLVTAVAVPANTVFGLAAAWAISKHDFPGKALLAALVDLPLSVSPIVAGLVYVLLFGRSGLLGGWLFEHGFRVIFAVPGIVLVTTFVTFPLVARELIPLMVAQGRDEELAARVLGASAWRTLWRVTLPNVKWGLLYGVIIATARAMGEFGAVSVVSGHIRGVTNTLPLDVEIRYNEYDFVGAFAAASLLTVFGLVTLALKTWVEWRGDVAQRRALHAPPAGDEHGHPG